MANKPRRWLSQIMYAGFVIVLGVSLWVFFRTAPLKVEVAKVTRGHFEETLLIDGKIRSRNRLTVGAFTTGDLERIDLKVGDLIKKGQRITTLIWDFRKDVRSPMDGVIAKVYRESAGPVLRGDPLVDILDPNDLEIVAEVLTTDAVRIPEGARVFVSGLGIPQVLLAKVVGVSRAGFIKISALGVEEERTELRMSFDRLPRELLSRIGDTFHVELSILISQDENVLKIPLSAVFKDQSKWKVYAVEDKKAAIKEISILKKNDYEVVVGSGLSEGDLVIVFPGDTVAPGKRIQWKEVTTPSSLPAAE